MITPETNRIREVEIRSKPEPLRPTFSRGNSTLTVIPVEPTDCPRTDGELYAKALRIERTGPCGTQSRVVSFEGPVKVTKNSVFIQVSGRCRRRVEIWQPLDPWLVFSGDKRDIRELEKLGMR